VSENVEQTYTTLAYSAPDDSEPKDSISENSLPEDFEFEGSDFII
jgi:hypothetical protein